MQRMLVWGIPYIKLALYRGFLIYRVPMYRDAFMYGTRNYKEDPLYRASSIYI